MYNHKEVLQQIVDNHKSNKPPQPKEYKQLADKALEQYRAELRQFYLDRNITTEDYREATLTHRWGITRKDLETGKVYGEGKQKKLLFTIYVGGL